MTNRELKALKRPQLLELLLTVTKENESLRQEIEELNRRLEEKTITLNKAGSIAEAALQLSGIFEAAQSAADRYLVSVQAMASGSDVPLEAPAARSEETPAVEETEKAVPVFAEAAEAAPAAAEAEKAEEAVPASVEEEAVNVNAAAEAAVETAEEAAAMPVEAEEAAAVEAVEQAAEAVVEEVAVPDAAEAPVQTAAPEAESVEQAAPVPQEAPIKLKRTVVEDIADTVSSIIEVPEQSAAPVQAEKAVRSIPVKGKKLSDSSRRKVKLRALPRKESSENHGCEAK